MSGRGATSYPVVLEPVAITSRFAPEALPAGFAPPNHIAPPTEPTAPTEFAAPTGFELLGGPSAVRDAIGRWLRLVTADGELAPYLVGVDVARLAGHLALLLTTALGGPAGDIARPVVGAWRGLGLTEEHHRRVVDYLTGVLWAMDLPATGIALVGRAFAGEASR